MKVPINAALVYTVIPNILKKSLNLNLKLTTAYFQGQKVTTFRASDLMGNKKLDTIWSSS